MRTRIALLIAGIIAVMGISVPAYAAEPAMVPYTIVSAEQNALDLTHEYSITKYGPVSAAKRTTQNGCPDNNICLYQCVNFNCERWQSSFANFWNWPNDCISLLPYDWSNGTPIADNSGSMIGNGTGSYPGGSSYGQIHNYYNCATAGGVSGIPPHLLTKEPDLHNVLFYGVPGGPTLTAYHTITSVSFKLL